MDIWKMIEDGFGFDFSLKTQTKPTAVGYEAKQIGDWDDHITYIVYFTNEAHTEEFGDIEYFDEDWMAEEFAKETAKKYNMKYVGAYEQ